MSAEQLIALEAALTEVSALYAAARGFTALRLPAESDLLPTLLTLGSKLRGLLRTEQLSQQEIDLAAKQILSVRANWRSALDQVRTSSVYQEALAAFAADRQEDLARVIPSIFAGLTVVRPAPTLFFPVSPSVGRRRSGGSPFLSAAECADRILQTIAAGIEPEEGGSEWWEHDLPCLACVDRPDALDTPITLRLAGSDVRVAVFAAADEAGLHIFTPRLRAPMSVVVASDATDEWWQAYEDSYRAFREALEHKLAARNQRVTLADVR